MNPRRNAPCPCKSGKKWKQCCGSGLCVNCGKPATRECGMKIKFIPIVAQAIHRGDNLDNITGDCTEKVCNDCEGVGKYGYWYFSHRHQGEGECTKDIEAMEAAIFEETFRTCDFNDTIERSRNE